jgi:hypothetical protein
MREGPPQPSSTSRRITSLKLSPRPRSERSLSTTALSSQIRRWPCSSVLFSESHVAERERLGNRLERLNALAGRAASHFAMLRVRQGRLTNILRNGSKCRPWSPVEA